MELFTIEKTNTEIKIRIICGFTGWLKENYVRAAWTHLCAFSNGEKALASW
jgi:hypothetical protein